MEIRVLVLGNDTFAQKLDEALKVESIEHTLDKEPTPGVAYDLCVCHPDSVLLSKILDQCGSKILVFNGMKIANSTLKQLVKMRINGFLDDHSDIEPAMDILRGIRNSKNTMKRLLSKMATLCSRTAERQVAACGL